MVNMGNLLVLKNRQYHYAHKDSPISTILIEFLSNKDILTSLRVSTQTQQSIHDRLSTHSLYRRDMEVTKKLVSIQRTDSKQDFISALVDLNDSCTFSNYQGSTNYYSQSDQNVIINRLQESIAVQFPKVYDHAKQFIAESVLFRDPESISSICELLAANPLLPSDILERLYGLIDSSFNPSGLAETIANIASHPNLPKDGYDQLLSVFLTLPYRKLELITRLAKGLAKSHWTTTPTQIKAMKDHLDALSVDDDCDPILLIYKKMDLTFAFLQNKFLPVDFISEERQKVFKLEFWESLNHPYLTYDLLTRNTFFKGPVTQSEFKALTDILVQICPLDETRARIFHGLVTHLKVDVNKHLINYNNPDCVELVRKMERVSLNLSLAITGEQTLSRLLGAQAMTDPSMLVLIDTDLLSLIEIPLEEGYLDDVKQRVQNRFYGSETSRISDLLGRRPEIANQIAP